MPPHTSLQSLSMSILRCCRIPCCLLCVVRPSPCPPSALCMPKVMCTFAPAPPDIFLRSHLSTSIPFRLVTVSPLLWCRFSSSDVSWFPSCTGEWYHLILVFLHLPALLHWVWCPLTPSVFLQMVWFVFLWLNNIPLFIYWWTLSLAIENSAVVIIGMHVSLLNWGRQCLIHSFICLFIYFLIMNLQLCGSHHVYYTPPITTVGMVKGLRRLVVKDGCRLVRGHYD